ncbi:glycoside hydrolase family 3 N-terminal domain-containing protein [Fictibacillus nanhaiensis]|uniref:glycoside hydrolase family 3 N-terminal domain-containing protein n=1 Tax=Fictibacillus nanhaiensis TaxID=742169 RepID=UPI002E1CF8C3|nr:glycoside hydrolase family 3 N-terminal domain-containing protein [Fictibacillus nanhaiensis]MED1863926.1 glycoside hydrolase family 3 N-terminal domain-containing protein [Fictibacillus nanhaiensis]
MNEENIQALLQEMTLKEKIGQLTQITGEHYVGKIEGEMVETGPGYWDQLLEGDTLYTIGSVIGVSSAEATNMIQSAYLEKSRLKIPLLFMHDAIHGYKTIFPIPLALSCTWDEGILEKVAAHTASELRAAGITVNFSPMVDLVRDARWGRVIESFGEDHLLSGNLGGAMIRGYQKDCDGKISGDGVAACLKHFAAYGAAVGGKDYNTVDMSMREFFEYYGKPYEIALNDKPKFVMSSFNTFNGTPVTASEEMMKDILRDRYQFENIVISDWGAVAELQNHRVAANGKEAAELALTAGIDIEMVSTLYLENYQEIVSKHPQLLEDIDAAVLKILQLKNELGLFEYPYVDEEKEKQLILNEEFLQFSKEAAKKSCVLLKNEELLPIPKNVKNVLIVGPFAKTKELLGNWPCKGSFDNVISLTEGLQSLDGPLNVKAYETLEECPQDELVQSDYIIAAIGERWDLSGEGHSSVHIELEDKQQELIREIKRLNKPYACVCFSGRPLALQNIIDDIPALLWCWYPGTQAGTAIAELLTGIDTPSGKLTMSFPRYSSQVPIHYNEYSSGRPANDSSYSSRYQDCEVGPLFSFGDGLTYTNTKYSNIKISNSVLKNGEELTISFQLENSSSYEYPEIVILYIEDLVSKVVRPTREMKKYKVVHVPAHETVNVELMLTVEDLTYLNNHLQPSIEPGTFNLYINDLKQPIGTFNYEVETIGVRNS